MFVFYFGLSLSCFVSAFSFSWDLVSDYFPMCNTIWIALYKRQSASRQQLKGSRAPQRDGAGQVKKNKGRGFRLVGPMVMLRQKLELSVSVLGIDKGSLHDNITRVPYLAIGSWWLTPLALF
jgi:hypothetical protein